MGSNVSIYLPLRGPGHAKPKAAARKGWESPDYSGVDPDQHGWVGLRADGLVIVDCDTAEAVTRWREIGTPTYEVQTPRGGSHFYYRWVPGAPTGPAVNVFGPGSKIDIRAGRGSYVVSPPTPGYVVVNKRKPVVYKSAWIPERNDATDNDPDDEWDVIPDGRRNDTLTAFAGAFRRQGMSLEVIFQMLRAMNRTIVDQGSDPITDAELEAITRSVGRYEIVPDWEVEIDTGRPDASDATLLQWMAGMTMPPPPEWHWKPYLPKGRLVLLDGSEGIGKGLLCAYLATRIARDAGTVLWMSTEDDPEEDIQRRLLAAGHNRDDHHGIGFFTVDPKFPTDVETLETLIEEHKTQLVIMDPGRSYLAPPDGVRASFNDEAAIRPGLEALNRLAKRSKCTIVFVHHWNKNTQTTTQYRAGGSGAFAQVVRHRITLAWHGPTDGGTGAFEVSKSNIGPKGHVHGYGVVPVAAYDTVVFDMTEPLDNFTDIGEWLKAQERDDDSIELDRIDDITEHIKALPAGAPVPAVAALQKDYGVKRLQAQSIIDGLLEQGVLRRAAQGRKLFRRGDDEL